MLKPRRLALSLIALVALMVAGLLATWALRIAAETKK